MKHIIALSLLLLSCTSIMSSMPPLHHEMSNTILAQLSKNSPDHDIISLMKQPYNPNYSSPNESGLIFCAFEKKRWVIVDELLQHKEFDPHQRDNNNIELLEYCITKKKPLSYIHKIIAHPEFQLTKDLFAVMIDHELLPFLDTALEPHLEKASFNIPCKQLPAMSRSYKKSIEWTSAVFLTGITVSLPLLWYGICTTCTSCYFQ